MQLLPLIKRKPSSNWKGLVLLVAVIIVFLVSSCVTEKQRAKICRTCTIKEVVEKVDSSWQKKYDSLLSIPVKGPIIIMKDNPCAELCDTSGKVKDFTKTVISETGIKGTIKGDKKTNSITVDCGSADSLKVLLKDARVENNRLIKEKRTEQIPSRCTEEHRTLIDKFLLFWFWFSAPILLFFGVRLYLRIRRKIPL